MQGRKAFVVSPNKNEITENRHSSLGHFLDLIDACSFDLQIEREFPNETQLASCDAIFIDCKYIPHDALADIPVMQHKEQVKIILFNAPANEQIEIAAIKLGATGVFYAHDALDIILKGISAIKQQKKWFRRECLVQVVNELLDEKPFTGNITKIVVTENSNHSSLTRREKTIVSFIGDGAQNQEIADQLHISVNTVKTHIYSIFRKTQCRNRVELIKWSLSNLSPLAVS
ncbi:response regulator transcription factor [Aliiglaciecola sp.]|nr:response regulator transcription factor [Aliiglaciecola sp.]